MEIQHSYDLSKINFKINSPYISNQDKLFFLNEFINEGFKLTFNVKTCKTFIDISLPNDNLDNKLLNRIGYYLKTGTLSLGGIQEYHLSNIEIRKKLFSLLDNINKQFDIFVKNTPHIINELQDKLQKGMLKFESLFKPYEVKEENQLNEELVFSNREEIQQKSHPHLFNVNKNWQIRDYVLSSILELEKGMATINAADVGLGKAQPLTAKILTPFGWKLMKDIKKDDQVLAYDGSVSNVVDVFPQGKKDVYKITMNDGSSTHSCKEHLWFTQTLKELNESYKSWKKNGVKTLLSGSVKELQNISAKEQHAIPTVLPIEFNIPNQPKLKIHPYLLGCLLAQNNSNPLSQHINNLKREVLINISDLYYNQEYGTEYFVLYQNGEDCLVIYPNDKDQETINNLSFEKYLSELGLDNVKEDERFIPEFLLTSSIEQRISLIQGLFDCAATLNEKNKSIFFHSKSLKLHNGVKQIILSLGGTCSIRFNEERQIYTSKITLSSHFNLIPFRTQFKMKVFKSWKKTRALRTIFDIEYVGKEECQCIMIDHPEHLYITDDFIVTHNTSISLMAIQNLQNKQIKNKTLFVVPNSALSNFYKEAFEGEPKNNKPSVLISEEDSLFINLNKSLQKKQDFFSQNYFLKSRSAKNDTSLLLEEKSKKKDLKTNNFQRTKSFKSSISKLLKLSIDEQLFACKDPQIKKLFLTYEDFYRFKLKPETIQAYVNYLKENDESFYNAIDNGSKKAINFLSKLERLTKSGNGKSKEELYFEDFDFDSLVVDELHVYKNSKELFGNINAKYLSIPPISIRGLDAQIKSWFIRNRNKQLYGKEDGVLGLTATPLTNSPLEYYSLLTLIVGEENFNHLIGLNGVYDFMESTCEIDLETDYSVDGLEKDFNVFKGIRNLSILRPAMFKVIKFLSHNDVRSDIKLPFEEVKLHKPIMDSLQQQKIKAYKFVYGLCKQIYYASEEEMELILSSPEWNDYCLPILMALKEDVQVSASPFNFIRKMERVIFDNDLEEQGISFYVKKQSSHHNEKDIAHFIQSFNKKNLKEKRIRPSKNTDLSNVKEIKSKVEFKVDGKDIEEEHIDKYEIKICLYDLPFISELDNHLGLKKEKIDFYNQQLKFLRNEENIFSLNLNKFASNNSNISKDKNNDGENYKDLNFKSFKNSKSFKNIDSFESFEKNYVNVFLDSLDYNLQKNVYVDLIKQFGEENVILLGSSKINNLLKNLMEEHKNPRGKIKNIYDNQYQEEIHRIVKQLVFCDHLGSHLKLQHFISLFLDIPFEKIAIITGQTNNQPEEVLEIQNYFNANNEDNLYQIIIANEKAEVSINLQNGTQAIHHLTFGWTPDSIHQRNGRAVRQGNYTDFVNIYFYDTPNTFDTYKRNLVSKKENWISKMTDPNGEDFVPIPHNLTKKQYEEMIEKLGDENLEELQAKFEKENELKELNDIIEKQKIYLNFMTTQRIQSLNSN